MTQQTVASGMNNYYKPGENGEPSAYAKRFGPYAVPANEILLITSLVIQALEENHGFERTESEEYTKQEMIKQIIAESEIFTDARQLYNLIIQKRLLQRPFTEYHPVTINIIDYGCGDGRHLPFYIELAKALRNYGITINLCGYEIGEVSLQQFSANALSSGFAATGANILTLDNLNLYFAWDQNPDADPAEKQQFIYSQMGLDTATPVFDVGLCLFGVVAYETEITGRAKIIRTLFDSCSSAVLFSVPNPIILQDGQFIPTENHGSWVRYTSGGSSFGYALFGDNAFNFPMEMALATTPAGTRLFHMQIPLTPGDRLRPTHGSQNLETYIDTFADAANGHSLGLSPYVPYIMRPDVQREANLRTVRRESVRIL